ncbi:MAG: Re/Si-specific NAD(P)(+) transhydrogenase subunit alpha [Candidatus Eiseniibacteriota bacterium]|jgi:NAD(P) transhydrogenase subunit alpha
MPKLFVPRETQPGETRVAATPETVKRYVADGFEVLVEAGAGAGASIVDARYEGAGASIVTDAAQGYGAADLTLKVNAPGPAQGSGKHEADLLREGSILVSFLWPLQNLELVKQLNARRITVFAMDQVPRITRAQKMDALSSQANIGGYKAVILAADHLPKIFPLLMTAAGTITPAKVVIMGAGVAGLQAIATARRLGAVVEVSDVRKAVKEQVESLGGRFIELETDEDLEDAGGYAREQSEEDLKKQQALVRQHIVQADVVITTALIPGKPAPRLVTADMVREMREGAVIVDMAVIQGGNCELSELDQVIEKDGVTIIGHSNLPALVPFHSSDVYAKNLLAIVQHLYKKAELQLDLEDEISAGAIVMHDGTVRMAAAAEALGSGSGSAS